MSESRVIVALDYADAESANNLVRRLDPTLCKLKVGKELFTASGPQFVSAFVDKGFQVFLDLKFHDIPNTVAKACEAAARLGVWMVNVHASGGPRMLQAAREAIDKSNTKPLLIGVTVLTSMDQAELTAIGITATPAGQVQRLASLAHASGLDGVVCSAQEARQLRDSFGKEFCLVTPGIRPKDSEKADQRRVLTPLDAIKAGANYLVIGRPITQAVDPVLVLQAINAEIEAG